jgi:ABC-type glycerol-3-phosphate transport system substrate-binding protein
MSKFLGSLTLIAMLALSGAAFACSAEKSAASDAAPVTTATSQPATDGTTTAPKTTEVKTGG